MFCSEPSQRRKQKSKAVHVKLFSLLNVAVSLFCRDYKLHIDLSLLMHFVESTLDSYHLSIFPPH